jgi:mannosyltransferase OCH1-like enzyme
MIPKIIHYAWFGNTALPENVKGCIASWKKTNPDFEIKLWNEENVTLNDYPFALKMYQQKKWAFVVDHIRLVILEREGGIFLDADMYLLQSLSPLVDKQCVLGKESDEDISAGMIASIPHHPFIKKCLSFYEKNPTELITIPRVLTEVFTSYEEKDSIFIYPPKTFYPIDAENIGSYHGQFLGNDVLGVHLWNYSWGHPLNKFFKKIKIYKIGKTVAEKLKIKYFLKKILGFV